MGYFHLKYFTKHKAHIYTSTLNMHNMVTCNYFLRISNQAFSLGQRNKKFLFAPFSQHEVGNKPKMLCCNGFQKMGIEGMNPKGD